MTAIFRVFSRRLPCTTSGSDAMVPFTRVLTKLSSPRGFATDSKADKFSVYTCNVLESFVLGKFARFLMVMLHVLCCSRLLEIYLEH